MKKIWLDKLLVVMEERGLEPKPLSLAAGLNETYLRDVVKRGADPTIGKLTQLADYLGLPVGYFFNEEPLQPKQVPVVGYAAGGEEWVPISDYPDGDGIDSLSLDFSDVDPIAIRVKGHSMAPVFRDGDDLICSRRRGIDIGSVVGKDCVVHTMKGQAFIKHVLKGTVRNSYRLRSYNTTFADIDNVALDWAAPVIWIKRKEG